MTRLIGLVGPLGGGKTTTAKILEDHGFIRWRMAETLKQMLRTAGLTEEQVDGSLKESPTALLCGKTPRHAMQTLGTEWARDCIGPDFWVNVMANRLDALWYDHPKACVVIDDIRFENEVGMIRELGGELWRISGRVPEKPVPALKRVSQFFGIGRPHASEALWKTFAVDREIDNSGTKESLTMAVSSELVDLYARELEHAA